MNPFCGSRYQTTKIEISNSSETKLQTGYRLHRELIVLEEYMFQYQLYSKQLKIV